MAGKKKTGVYISDWPCMCVFVCKFAHRTRWDGWNNEQLEWELLGDEIDEFNERLDSRYNYDRIPLHGF